MALSCVYTVVNGMMLKETRNGVETEYVPDTNGNLWMTRDMSGNVTSTTDYWPYGEVQTTSGTNPSPLGFGGIVGYITDTLTQLYVRARSYRADRARWVTVDPLWPAILAYEYALDSPALYLDPLGLCVRHSSASIRKCLDTDPNGYSCVPGNGCHPNPNSEVDDALAMCMFYYENGLCDSNGPKDNGGGMGQLTGPTISDLEKSCCNKGVLSKGDTQGGGWCNGARASFMWLKCRGLDHYGDATYKAGGAAKIRACAKCVRRGEEVRGRLIFKLDDLSVYEENIDGFPKVKVCKTLKKENKVVFSYYNHDLFLVSAQPWPIPISSPALQAVRFTFSYTTGSMQKALIIAPSLRDKWKVVLDANIENAFNYPPECVDLRGDGLADIIGICKFRTTERNGSYRFDPLKTTVKIWRWNQRNFAYMPIAVRSYRHRLDK